MATKRIDIRILMLVLLSICAGLVFISFSLPTLAYPHSIDPIEGTILSVSRSLARGNNIYSPHNYLVYPFQLAIYTPVYYFLVSLLIKCFGVAFWPCRLLSLVGTIACSLFIGKIIFLKTKQIFYSFLGGFLFLSFYSLWFWGSLVRVDTLALVFSLIGLYVFIKTESHAWKFLLSIPFFLLAFYTKQTSISALASISIYFLCKNKKKAIQLILLTGIIGFTVFVILNFFSSGGFFFSIITADQNPILFSYEKWVLEILFSQNIPIIVLLISFYLVMIKIRQLSLISTYFLMSSIITLLTIGKIGANFNYFIELAAASSLVLSISLKRLNNNRFVGLILVLLLAFLVKDVLTYRGEILWRLSLPKREPFAGIIEFIQENSSSKSKLLSTEPGLLLNAEREVGLSDFFQFTLLQRQGKWSEDELLDMISKKEFILIVVNLNHMMEEKTPWGNSLGSMLSKKMRIYIAQNYVIGWSSEWSDWVVYVPKK